MDFGSASDIASTEVLRQRLKDVADFPGLVQTVELYAKQNASLDVVYLSTILGALCHALHGHAEELLPFGRTSLRPPSFFRPEGKASFPVAELDGALNCVRATLIPRTKDAACRAVLYLWSADLRLFIWESSQDAQLLKYVACDLGRAFCYSRSLPAVHAVRIHVALCIATFKYEVLHEAELATKMAKEAFDEAIMDLDQLEEEQYKDTTFTMQAIRDKLFRWTSS